MKKAIKALIVLALFQTSCLKTIPSGKETKVSYYLADQYFEPLGYRTPACGLEMNVLNASLKQLNGRWKPMKAYIERDYTVTFYKEDDTSTKLSFKFPMLRRGESASYFYSAQDVWTAKGPNSLKITGQTRVGGYTIPIIVGDEYKYDTLSVLHTGKTLRVQGCKVPFIYYVNGMELKEKMNFDLEWEDFQ